MKNTITVNRAYGRAVTGEALVMREGFSPRYDLDRLTGVISRIGHSAEGKSLKNKVLIIPTSKGGVAAGWAFQDIKEKGFAPAAFVFGKANPVMVQGAILAEIPITDGWSANALDYIVSGDIVHVDPATLTIEILHKAG